MNTLKAEMVNSENITAGEARVLLKLCEGKSNKMIANELGVGIAAIEAMINRLYEKNNLKWAAVNARATLIVTAITQGVVRVTSQDKR